MTKLVLDSIIYGLQRFGGISNFWSELIAARPPVDSVEILLPRTLRAATLPDMARASVRREALPTRVSRYLRAEPGAGADILHTSYYRLPRRRVGRYITSVYDFTYERYFNGIARRVHHHQKAASVVAADLCLCISEATRVDLLEQFPQMSDVRARVVPLGVDTKAFYHDPSSRPERPYVLFVGQRQGYKRFDLAVLSVMQLRDVSLAVAGPPLTDDEKNMLEHYLPGRWREHAGVGRDVLRRLYSDAFAFIFPSDYEGFGLPILEAMACGCPVVAADRSSFPEVVGTATPLAERQEPDAYVGLLRRLQHDDARQHAIREGARRVASFSWQRSFEQLWAFYQ
ncbi:glycosyltransferase family 1 protein [Sphingomonas sp. BK235]|uniref:glycosyltransferase family 4 protein n=1 Tax=Sphingomonas sp. BK235 TaxID=2512131 RepID=UPI00104A9D37|nr:glycosyltransferase family 1 protein [Sphingomonas sp. BK235]TCP29376.1 mannosyltransferase [Sphingomonas sp. BK235]